MGSRSSKKEIEIEGGRYISASVMMLGMPGCGKSCLRSRLLYDSPEPHCGSMDSATRKMFSFGVGSLILEVQDYSPPKKNFYSEGFVIVYSINSSDSFDEAKKHLEFCCGGKSKEKKRSEVILVGNKCDLPKRTVSLEEGLALAREWSIPFFETSALNGERVFEAFETISQQIYDPTRARKVDLLMIKRAR